MSHIKNMNWLDENSKTFPPFATKSFYCIQPDLFLILIFLQLYTTGGWICFVAMFPLFICIKLTVWPVVRSVHMLMCRLLA